jgi:hypothetical protein
VTASQIVASGSALISEPGAITTTGVAGAVLVVAAGVSLGEELTPAVALIPLRNRQGEPVAFAIVDADDVPCLSQWRWSYDYRGYAIRSENVGAKQRTRRMHRQVLDAFDDPRDVDHINRNRLDNRKANLRMVTRAENLANKSGVITEHPRSGVVGVRWDPDQRRWAAFAGYRRDRRRIGSYATVDEAADAIAAFKAGAA